MNDKTLYWHDYETFGGDPRRDRPAQFAGLRTDEALNEIGEPLMIYCKPALDVIPDPEACLITGISPRLALAQGLSEAEFCARIAAEFSRPGTCVAGYNSIRFDDEVTRHLFYRCFHDPYEREWKNGNSRWDIIDLVRLAHALRPQGIHWPTNAEGATSFRLEDLTRANNIEHEGAHDALSDVRATIALARLIREAQPRLYDYYFGLRFKNAVLTMLDLTRPRPLVHVSSMYPAASGCMAIVLPLARHPVNANGVIVYDLSVDPESWVHLDAEEIRRRVFSKKEDLAAEGIERIALKTIHANKCPALAPLGVLNDEVMARWGLDHERWRRYEEMLTGINGLAAKVSEAFKTPPELANPSSRDPDLMLYSGGFFSDADRAHMEEIRRLNGAELAGFDAPFEDERLPEMLFRYRGRNFPESLDAEERERWLAHCRQVYLAADANGMPALDSVRARIGDLYTSTSARDKAVLDELLAYLEARSLELGLKEPVSEP